MGEWFQDSQFGSNSWIWILQEATRQGSAHLFASAVRAVVERWSL